MVIAAVPKYLGTDFNQCPTGHRFTLYGQFWQEGNWKPVEGEERRNSLSALGGGDSCRTADSIVARQSAAAAMLGDSVACYQAQSTSPFVTGMGIEHPLENGMAFLNPYGVPYLPGSGVKGVLRRAAEELEGQGDAGWMIEDISVLFGPETTDAARRGALAFWDAVPTDVALAVDIMNPHHGKYFAGDDSPHDAESPVPIYFLVVAPGSRFRFHVRCDCRLAGPGLADRWRALLDAAFEHAFDWLGFGAKTAVGYGALTAITGEGPNVLVAGTTCRWVDETIESLAKQHNSDPDDILRGNPLNKEWAALEDSDLKERALADIQARWTKKGWWENPPGRAKRIKAAYMDSERDDNN